MCVLYNVYESLDYNIYIEIVYLLFLMIFFKVYSKDFYFIIFFLLQKFDCDEWGIGLDVMQVVLQLEKIVNQFLFDFYKVVDSYQDVQVKYVVFVFLNVF